MAAAHHSDFANGIFCKQFSYLVVGRVVAHLVGHTEADAALFYGGDDAVAVGQTRGHRFLQEHVFTRTGRSFDKAGVAVGLAVDEHGIYARVGE